MSIVNRFWNFFRKPSLDRDLDDELQFHIEARCEEYIAQGLDAAAALV